MTKEFDALFDFLKNQGLKLTNQREEILKIFLKTEKHLTVEELYHLVKRMDSNIGQATVFRTLKLLTEAGLARQTDLGDKKIRYEHSYGHSHHDHLVCTNCGKCIEVIDTAIERLQDKLCQRYKFSSQRYRLQIFGICKECRQ